MELDFAYEASTLIFPLRHTYFALRHGESKANVAGTVASLLDETDENGLTDAGREQVKKTVLKAIQENVLDENTLIYTSPFARTKETATITSSLLGAAEPIEADGLRERYFGDLDSGPSTEYQKVWTEDALDENSEAFGAESAAAVFYRTTKLLAKLEASDIPDSAIVLVAHGDTLQILETAFQSIAPGKHRSLNEIKPGELRKLESQQAQTEMDKSLK